MNAGPALLDLVVRRVIHAPAARLFAAWTEVEALKGWWGPEGVTCPEAEIDLRVGGRYRIANRFPDGSVVWISGTYEEIAPFERLVFTWALEPGAAAPERVTVLFEARGDATEIVVVHERIADDTARVSHEAGWIGCLDGLAEFAEGAPAP